MNLFSLILLVVAMATLLLSLMIVRLQRHKTRKTMKALNHMLDRALDGSFTEAHFDESLLSSVESRLYQYLTASLVSARNVSAEKEKIKQLLADISHQTKTPIANIMLYSQLLAEQELPEESKACLTPLQGQAEKLNFLITALIKLSRLETGVFTVFPTCAAIAPMLSEVTQQVAPKAAQKEIELTVTVTNGDAVFDYKWTLEALCNVVDNAIKYTPPGGKIQILVTEYEMFCRIDISDTGMGIAETDQAKIFTRFYRSPALSEQDGLGIGLYLTRQILIRQGGYIKVASSLGDGSVFSVFLPRTV